MKKLLAVNLSLAIFLAVFSVGCSSSKPSDGNVAPLDGGRSTIAVEISYDELLNTKHVSKQVEITYPGLLAVTLGSNPTTGFQWAENATVADQNVLQQSEHSILSPGATGAVGASSKDVWTFKSLKKGTTTISFDYSRPWQGGEKGEWTVELTVVVE